jgi:maltose alpha-D-glucosyltransferase/alpha-amylase
MLCSYNYAVSAVLFGQAAGVVVRAEDVPRLEPWANFWLLWTGSRFLRSYLEAADTALFLPGTREELHVLLDCFLLERTLDELTFDLSTRPEWVRMPLRGLLQLLDK